MIAGDFRTQTFYLCSKLFHVCHHIDGYEEYNYAIKVNLIEFFLFAKGSHEQSY